MRAYADTVKESDYMSCLVSLQRSYVQKLSVVAVAEYMIIHHEKSARLTVFACSFLVPAGADTCHQFSCFTTRELEIKISLVLLGCTGARAFDFGLYFWTVWQGRGAVKPASAVRPGKNQLPWVLMVPRQV